MTDEEYRAARDAVGWDVEKREVARAIDAWASKSLGFMHLELQRLEVQFEAAGGRGVEIADTIDQLRMALAVREIREGASG